MPRADAFITEILERFEGAGRRRGYVPLQQGRKGQEQTARVMGNSGVTIGTGVDLGQHSREALEQMGVPATIIGALVPYLGLQKEAALAKLQTCPLVLAEDAVLALDRAVIGHFITRMEERCNRAVQGFSGKRRPACFADRAKEVQAVLVSLAYHLGFGGFPRTFALLVSEAYREAIAELHNSAAWNHRYIYRRREEAALLEEACRREGASPLARAVPAAGE